MFRKQKESELKAVLKNRNVLTASSKINLKTELDKRNLFLDSSDYKHLCQLVLIETSKIKSFEHLGNHGIKIEKLDDNHIEFTRKWQFKIIDVIAIIIGIILIYFGAKKSIEMIFNYYNTTVDFGALDIIKIIIYAIILMAGFSLTNNALNRFIEFLDFKFTIKNDLATLTKRIQFKLLKKEKLISELHLKENDSSISLHLDNVEVFHINHADLIEKLTLLELSRTGRLVN